MRKLAYSRPPISNFPTEPGESREAELDEREQRIQVREARAWSFLIGACLAFLASLVAIYAAVVMLNERLPR